MSHFKLAASQRTSEPTNFGTTPPPPERRAPRRNSGFPIHSRPERGPKTLQKPRPRLRRAGLRPAVAVFACVFCLALAGYVVESQCSGAALAMPRVIWKFVGSEVRWLAANLKVGGPGAWYQTLARQLRASFPLWRKIVPIHRMKCFC